MNEWLAQIDPNIIIPSIIAGYAAVKSRMAEKNSRPVSNGFAWSVTSGLKNLQARLDVMNKDIRDIRERVIDHIDGHE
jgi:hypothetical protein